ncbi:hypothetical protein PUW25_25830 (plasmid) [Paenibacillus urinalis]|uniref:HTH arsR-type domain-containing protein n=1 Tax=Paenibacillus urinalis TaxID=521520 RepID=A0ABY7XL23_9BACL|nr:hypothetical protein [Paenibacillus urinalis]WDI05232.1 hypothetical protein PUW25_25830 [Paenibacillus urinalis]
MSAAPQKKVDRDTLLEHLKTMADDVGDIHVSPTVLGQEFEVSTASITHHLRVLSDEGKIVDTGRTGPHKKKIYRLSSSLMRESKVPQSKLIYPTINDESFMQKIKDSVKHLNIPKSIISSESQIKTNEHIDENTINQENYKNIEQDAPGEEEIISKNDFSISEISSNNKAEDSSDNHDEDDSFNRSIIEREKSLDDQIREFQAKSRSSSAQIMLEKDDREILSVAVESLNQIQMFFKDLTDQLSTIEEKKFIQALIEERNQNLQQIAELQNQISTMNDTINEMSSKKNKNGDIEQKAKNIYQSLLFIVDNFVDQPAHTMFLQKTEFRKDIGERVKELFLLAVRKE